MHALSAAVAVHSNIGMNMAGIRVVPGFASPRLPGQLASLSSEVQVCSKRRYQRYASYHQRGVKVVRASQLPSEENLPNGGTDNHDDAQLQNELREKVKELFGGSENVSIVVDGDRADFTVLTAPDGSNVTEYRQAIVTVASIALMSAAAGLLFTFLYYSGAVHGATAPQTRYEMPTYATRSYVDPYELLESERDSL